LVVGWVWSEPAGVAFAGAGLGQQGLAIAVRAHRDHGGALVFAADEGEPRAVRGPRRVHLAFRVGGELAWVFAVGVDDKHSRD